MNRPQFKLKTLMLVAAVAVMMFLSRHIEIHFSYTPNPRMDFAQDANNIEISWWPADHYGNSTMLLEAGYYSAGSWVIVCGRSVLETRAKHDIPPEAAPAPTAGGQSSNAILFTLQDGKIRPVEP